VFLGRLVDIGAELYAMSAACVRAAMPRPIVAALPRCYTPNRVAASWRDPTPTRFGAFSAMLIRTCGLPT